MSSNISEKKGTGFNTKIGFVLATAGSAVGLGNIWRFPYLTAKYGGGIFILVYIILAVTFGFTLMLTEIAIGRRTGKSVIGAYSTINKKFSFLGWLAAIVPFIITPYYCVIGGWVTKYFVSFTSGQMETITQNSGDYFSNFIGNLPESTIYFSIFFILTGLAVMLGVKKGIENLSKILMPLLLVLIVIIAFYTMTLNGAMDGLRYYLVPDFTRYDISKLPVTIVAAVGQLFYSMSIAMGILVTYGSYMRKEDPIEKSVRQIEVVDTAVALLAGLIIVPSVFVFSNGDPNALNQGPSLMFVTLPNVFNSMPAGGVIGAVFFFLVILAALTSSISLLETMVSIVSEKFKVKRVPSTLICVGVIIVLGMLSVLGFNVLSQPTTNFLESIRSAVDLKKSFGISSVLDIFDFISNNILMPLVAFATCILIGYIAKTTYVEEEILVSQKEFKVKKMYRFMIKILCPIFMIAILVTPFIVKL